MDLGVAEAREINGFPPTPRDGLTQKMGEGGGDQRLDYGMLSSQGYLGGTGGEGKR